MVWCALEGGTDMSKAMLQVLVPADAPGIATDGKWNTLGMRGTYSPTVTLAGVRVAADALLGGPGQALGLGVIEGFGLGYAAIYAGAAQRAFHIAVDFCTTHRFEPDPAPRARDPIVQHHVAEMSMALGAARLVLYQSACRWEKADAVERAVLAARAKYLTTEAALKVTADAIRIVGGRSAHRASPLERLFRDVRTATLMPPNADRSMELVGKAALGVADEAILARHAG